MIMTTRSRERAMLIDLLLAVRLGWSRQAPAALGLALAVTGASAQTVTGRARTAEAGSPELQARCARAAAALLSDTAVSVSTWVYGTIGQCELSGPDAIAHAWGVIQGTDPEQLNALVGSSRAIRDNRIFQAETSALGGPMGGTPRPAAVRLAAINALVGYAVPDAAPYPFSAALPAYIVRITDLPQPVSGGQPLMSNVLGYVRFSLMGVSSTGFGPPPAAGSGPPPDPTTVAGRATLALQALNAVEAAAAATPALGAITLTAVCGTQFRIVSQHPQPLQLQYTVDGTTLPAAEVGVPANGRTVFTAPVTGTVRLSYPGIVLATMQSSTQPCQ